MAIYLEVCATGSPDRAVPVFASSKSSMEGLYAESVENAYVVYLSLLTRLRPSIPASKDV
jgi:hypothetical protein